MVDIARHGCVGTYFEDHQVRYEVKAAREIIIRVLTVGYQRPQYLE